MLKGIDISMHNWDYLASRDFYDIKAADFVLMKASEGRTFKDLRLDYYYNILHGSCDGRPDKDKCYGFYHYARPEHNDAASEALQFLGLVGHHAKHAVFALDVEGDALNVDKSYLDYWVITWAQIVKRYSGVMPLIYCSRSETSLFPSAAAAGCGLWCASWGNRKPTKQQIKPWDLLAIWQNGTTNCHLDTDIFYGSADQWKMYAGLNHD